MSCVRPHGHCDRPIVNLNMENDNDKFHAYKTLFYTCTSINTGSLLNVLTNSRLRASRRPCTAGREAYTNFADERDDNVWSEAVTIHRLEDTLKMPSCLHVDIFCTCLFP
jgi:hypothetical protein